MMTRRGFVACAGMACAVTAAVGQIEFQDATASAGLASLPHDTHSDFAQIGPFLYSMTGGGCVGDFNGDGWQDVFLVGGGDAPDRLLINNGDGTFTDDALGWGVAASHLGIGASATDFDGDGQLDIFVTSLGPINASPTVGAHRLYRNTGTGFVDVAVAAGVEASSSVIPDGFGSAWGDIDLDGDLDMFVGGWMKNSNGDRLFLNNGDGTLSDISNAAGIVQNVARAFSPRFVDMDGDRYPELLIAGDFGTSRYWRNDGSATFTDITAASGTGLDGNGMGQAVGDFDGNGLLDWYVSSIESPDSHAEMIPGTGNLFVV